MSIQVETVESVRDDINELIYLHWDEIALNKDKIKLAPDWETYELLDKLGKLSIVTIRENGKLIGYCIEIMNKHMHYKNNIFAMNDIFFIHPDYRKSMKGVRLFKAVEKNLIKHGVDVWVVHIKTHMSAAPLLKRMGFGLIEENYSKYIGG